MSFWIKLFIIEIIPLFSIIFGGVCESSCNKYPNIKIGYKNKNSVKNKFIWEYSNKVASKILGSLGTFLFIINAVIIIVLGDSILFLTLFINIIFLVLFIVIINKVIVKKLNNKNK